VSLIIGRAAGDVQPRPSGYLLLAIGYRDLVIGLLIGLLDY